MVMRMERSLSFTLVAFTSTMRLPYTLPSLIITAVEIRLRVSFWQVPLFMREEPVTTSGPGTGAMVISAWRDISLSRQHTSAMTGAPSERA